MLNLAFRFNQRYRIVAMCSMISHKSIFNNPCGVTISLYANLKCQKID